MQNAERRGINFLSSFCIVHSALCNLTSAPSPYPTTSTTIFATYRTCSSLSSG